MVDIHIKTLIERDPLMANLVVLHDVTWFNLESTSLAGGLPYVGLGHADVQAADARLRRFAPYLRQVFPVFSASEGIIESDMVDIDAMQTELDARYGKVLPGKLWLKKDSHLPISGSIKARGGIYEVLVHAEQLALQAGLIAATDDYRQLASEAARYFFSQYRIAVGSTGNLGMSIGIMGATLGFKVSVYMSADARQSKKDRLRAHGVEVVEYQQDYGVAVEQGRKAAQDDPYCFFIDDENSRSLFLGYSVTGERLKAQFAERGMVVDADHPLFVYLPCGVGGGPSGVAFGLKLAFGDHVHCIFAERAHSPCMLLAVGCPSGFVGRPMARLIDGYYTLSNEEMYRLLAMLAHTKALCLEPSALAGMAGPWRVADNAEYLSHLSLSTSAMQQATHLVWATGAGMVPDAEMQKYLAHGVK